MKESSFERFKSKCGIESIDFSFDPLMFFFNEVVSHLCYGS